MKKHKKKNYIKQSSTEPTRLQQDDDSNNNKNIVVNLPPKKIDNHEDHTLVIFVIFFLAIIGTMAYFLVASPKNNIITSETPDTDDPTRPYTKQQTVSPTPVPDNPLNTSSMDATAIIAWVFFTLVIICVILSIISYILETIKNIILKFFKWFLSFSIVVLLISLILFFVVGQYCNIQSQNVRKDCAGKIIPPVVSCINKYGLSQGTNYWRLGDNFNATVINLNSTQWNVVGGICTVALVAAIVILGLVNPPEANSNKEEETKNEEF